MTATNRADDMKAIIKIALWAVALWLFAPTLGCRSDTQPTAPPERVSEEIASSLPTPDPGQ